MSLLIFLSVYRCRCLQGKSLKDSKNRQGEGIVKYVLLRVYGNGTELMIDREKELHVKLSKYFRF